MGKHTAGKWTVEPHGNTTALYCDRDNMRHGLRLMNLDDGDINFEANARLIAASPSLYKWEEGSCSATSIYYRANSWEKTSSDRRRPPQRRQQAK